MTLSSANIISSTRDSTATMLTASLDWQSITPIITPYQCRNQHATVSYLRCRTDNEIIYFITNSELEPNFHLFSFQHLTKVWQIRPITMVNHFRSGVRVLGRKAGIVLSTFRGEGHLGDCFYHCIHCAKRRFVFCASMCNMSRLVKKKKKKKKKKWLVVVLRLNVPVNNFSVISGRSHRFLGK